MKNMKKVIGFRPGIMYRGRYAVLECGHEVYCKESKCPSVGDKRLCRVCKTEAARNASK